MKSKQKTLKIALIAGGSRKLKGKGIASLIYGNSSLFRRSYEYCKSRHDKTYILSVKYGLIKPTKEIKSYNDCLDFKHRRELKDWLELISEQIKQTIPPGSELYFHTGKRYYKLIPYLKDYKCFTPMKGMGIGKRLKFYITEGSQYDK